MTDWQPIETAPKDGTTIIVSDLTKERFCFAYWYDGNRVWLPSHVDAYDFVDILFYPAFWTTTDFLKAYSPA